MIDEQRKSDEAAYARLRRAAVPFAGLGEYPDLLFDRTRPVISDRLRTYALGALSSLLSALGERLVYEVEDFGKSLDLQQSLDRLMHSHAVREPRLAAALVHRAEEREICDRLESLDELVLDAAPGEQADLLSALHEHSDTDVRRRAHRYSRLAGVRSGAGGVCLLPDELPPEVADSLYWNLAASLSAEQPVRTVEAVARAADRLLAERDIVRSPQHAAVSLMERLAERGDLGDSHIYRALLARDPLLACAALSVRGELSTGTAWLLLARGGEETQAALFQALGFQNGPAVRIIAVMQIAAGSQSSLAEARRSAEVAFGRVDAELAKRALRWWRLEPAFRMSWERLTQC